MTASFTPDQLQRMADAERERLTSLPRITEIVAVQAQRRRLRTLEAMLAEAQR